MKIFGQAAPTQKFHRLVYVGGQPSPFGRPFQSLCGRHQRRLAEEWPVQVDYVPAEFICEYCERLALIELTLDP